MEHTANLGLKLPGPGDDILDVTGAPKDINDNMAALDGAVMPKNIFATIDPANGFVDKAKMLSFPVSSLSSGVFDFNEYKQEGGITVYIRGTATVANGPSALSPATFAVENIRTYGGNINPDRFIQILYSTVNTVPPTGRIWYRQYIGPERWGEWTSDVQNTGDTMTGDLTIQKTAPNLVLKRANGTVGSALQKNADDVNDYGTLLADYTPAGYRAVLGLRRVLNTTRCLYLTYYNDSGVGAHYYIYHEGNTGIDSGSNADGSWTKWPDGTMVCTKVISATAAITQASGAIFLDSAGVNCGSWPQAFVSVPTINVSLVGGTGNGVWNGPQANASASSCGLFILMSAEQRNSYQINVHITGTGRWK